MNTGDLVAVKHLSRYLKLLIWFPVLESAGANMSTQPDNDSKSQNLLKLLESK